MSFRWAAICNATLCVPTLRTSQHSLYQWIAAWDWSFRWVAICNTTLCVPALRTTRGISLLHAFSSLLALLLWCRLPHTSLAPPPFFFAQHTSQLFSHLSFTSGLNSYTYSVHQSCIATSSHLLPHGCFLAPTCGFASILSYSFSHARGPCTYLKVVLFGESYFFFLSVVANALQAQPHPKMK